MYNLLTYNQSVNLTKRGDDTFYESKFVIDGFNISIFNYRLVQYSDFKDNSAFETRGITYVFNSDGSLFKRYLLLHKFFNLNQVEETQYSLIKDYQIKSISNKEDGSVASFIRLPNGRVIAKSKMSFESDQAVGMMRIYNFNKELRDFVNWSLDNDIISVFEYVSPQNRIVLKYSDEELILLRLRDNKTGEYLDLSNYSDKIGSIRVAPSDVGTLDELVELSHSVEDKEGWIVQFTNGLFIKIKTSWYRNLHSIYTEDLYHENKLIKLIVDEKIDDIIGELKKDDILRNRVDEITHIIRNSINNKIQRVLKLYNEYEKINSIKEFALLYKNDIEFSDTMKYIKNIDLLESISKDWILKKTNRLEMARHFIENNKTIQ